MWKPPLAARLDAFTKYELYSHFLEDRGSSWGELVDDMEALSTLGLLDHDYHSFSEPVSAFSDLDQRGLLSQRVGDPIEPGSEEEPHVPDVGTRARARARFIQEHSDRSDLIMTWDRVIDPSSQRVRTLFDPFAEGVCGVGYLEVTGIQVIRGRPWGAEPAASKDHPPT